MGVFTVEVIAYDSKSKKTSFKNHTVNQTKHFSKKDLSIIPNNYIEVNKIEVFKVCLDNMAEGYVFETSLASTIENSCLIAKAKAYTSSVPIYIYQNYNTNNSIKDSIIVLTNQTYVDLAGMTIFTNKFDKVVIGPNRRLLGGIEYEPNYKEYHKKNQKLIIDKTKFTVGDLAIFNKIDSTIEIHKYALEAYKDENPFANPLYPVNLAGNSIVRKTANLKSELDGFETAYKTIHKDEMIKRYILLHAFSDSIKVIDTCANGYRIPFQNEWEGLFRAGKDTKYYWGDSEDSSVVSQYEYYKPKGYIKPVATKKANQLGLYDMFGYAQDYVLRKDPDNDNYYMRSTPSLGTTKDYKINFDEMYFKRKLCLNMKYLVRKKVCPSVSSSDFGSSDYFDENGIYKKELCKDKDVEMFRRKMINSVRFVRQIPAESCKE